MKVYTIGYDMIEIDTEVEIHGAEFKTEFPASLLIVHTYPIACIIGPHAYKSEQAFKNVAKKWFIDQGVDIETVENRPQRFFDLLLEKSKLEIEDSTFFDFSCKKG
jgi:hypothetical protein